MSRARCWQAGELPRQSWASADSFSDWSSGVSVRSGELQPTDNVWSIQGTGTQIVPSPQDNLYGAGIF
jgi:hypothetical protein